ncbi:hypothetical protein FACS1894156_1290 [Bacteroidia bacterium]|nr:hypothetical protein FACS1894156_1290 [Bacteroidia bacterium]
MRPRGNVREHPQFDYQSFTVLRYFKNIVFYLPLLLLLASCGVSQRAVNADFYRHYSQKWGIELSGKEDKKFIEAIDQWMGTPYKWGGNSKSGIDCSALVCALYKEAHNIVLPRTTSAMPQKLHHIVRKQNLQSEDIIFFSIKEKKMSHVGVYISKGNFVHASSSQGVRINNLAESYWVKYYAGAGRVPQVPAAKPATEKQKTKNKPATQPEKQKATTPPPPKKQAAKQPPNQPGSSNIDDVIIVFDKDF